jgi:hypothetical protein
VRLTPSPQTTKSLPIPAPMGGVNAVGNLMELPPTDCIYSVNFIPSMYGLEVRKGYADRGGTFGVGSTEVRTLIPYEGSTPSDDKLFACTEEGIYDATTGTYALDDAWASPTNAAGYSSYVSFTNIAGKFLLVCDEENGYHLYNESTDSWSTVVAGAGAGEIDGADPADFVYVMVWKNRVWFVERDTGTAWFLPPGQITGTVTRFDFGNKFMAGGYLSSLHNYTLDAGVGPDDLLVALSSSGDLVAYSGTDPANIATFNIVGVWNIGPLPLGRCNTTEVGGDLYVLSALGIVSLTQTLKGTEPGAIPTYITGKITPVIRAAITNTIGTRGWGLLSVTSEGVLIVTSPAVGLSPDSVVQYVMNLTTRAWGPWSGLPMVSAASWKGRLYFGDDTPLVYAYAGGRDEGSLTDSSIGNPIPWFLLTSYVGQGMNIRVQFIRPQFLAAANPLYEVEARYDFNINDTVADVLGTLAPSGSAGWEAAWSAALWSSGVLGAESELRGAMGIGRYAAIALTGKSVYKTVLVGFVAMADSGGMM